MSKSPEDRWIKKTLWEVGQAYGTSQLGTKMQATVGKSTSQKQKVKIPRTNQDKFELQATEVKSRENQKQIYRGQCMERNNT